jgi:uncharacterized membrane protein
VVVAILYIAQENKDEKFAGDRGGACMLSSMMNKMAVPISGSLGMHIKFIS